MTTTYSQDNADLRAILNLINRIGRDCGISTRSPRRPPAPAGMRYLTPAEIAERAAAVEAAAAAKIADADAELRAEIIEEMMAAGIARHVAANLTNTTAKMLAEGKKIRCTVIKTLDKLATKR